MADATSMPTAYNCGNRYSFEAVVGTSDDKKYLNKKTVFAILHAVAIGVGQGMRWRLGTLGNVVEMGTKMILRVIRSPLISSRAFTGDELVTLCHLELEGSGTSNNSFCPRAWNTGYTIRIKTIYGSNLIFGD